jgi:hypothetical protein
VGLAFPVVYPCLDTLNQVTYNTFRKRLKKEVVNVQFFKHSYSQEVVFHVQVVASFFGFGNGAVGTSSDKSVAYLHSLGR